MGDALIIRPAVAADVASIAQIYAHYVHETVISFETEAPDDVEMAERVTAISARYPYFVAVDGHVLLGYAYATGLYARDAYRWAAETTIYLAPESRGLGIGTRLYRVLINELRARGFKTAVGKVTLPNAASARLHEALGFTLTGTLNAIGYKHGCWHDVGIYQAELAERPSLPTEPVWSAAQTDQL